MLLYLTCQFPPFLLAESNSVVRSFNSEKRRVQKLLAGKFGGQCNLGKFAPGIWVIAEVGASSVLVTYPNMSTNRGVWWTRSGSPWITAFW
jgi:hypothetical protein